MTFMLQKYYKEQIRKSEYLKSTNWLSEIFIFDIIIFMKKITITATAESIEQVKELLVTGVDRIYVGEENHALRIPTNFYHMMN